MKKIVLIIVTAIGIAACKNNPAPPQNESGFEKFSTTDFTAADIANYYNTITYTLLERLYNKVADSSLIAYKNNGLDTQLPANDFIYMGAKWDTIQVPNSQSPDDIYDLIDTVLLNPIEPDKIVAYSINAGKNLFSLEITAGHTAYFKWDDIKKTLTAEQLAVLQMLSKEETTTIQHHQYDTLAHKQFNALAQQWYKMGTPATAYINHTLAKTYTEKELADRGQLIEYVKMPNPKNPGDETDLIMGQKITPFNPVTINTLRVFHKWVTTPTSASIALHAYAPVYTPMAGNMALQKAPLFILKADEITQKMNKDEAAFYYNLGLALLRNKGTVETYTTETFQQTEYWQ
jgi:GH24 family phage-related lysozyme (muramidase)